MCLSLASHSHSSVWAQVVLLPKEALGSKASTAAASPPPAAPAVAPAAPAAACKAAAPKAAQALTGGL